MPGRQYISSSGDYRFGFNGKEEDSEGMGGGGSTYDYGFRIYNPQLAKFLSVDPLGSSFPYYTPYQFAGNKPIVAVDLDGLEEFVFHYFLEDGKLTKLRLEYVNDTKDMPLKISRQIHHKNISEDGSIQEYTEYGTENHEFDELEKTYYDFIVDKMKRNPVSNNNQFEVPVVDGSLVFPNVEKSSEVIKETKKEVNQNGGKSGDYVFNDALKKYGNNSVFKSATGDFKTLTKEYLKLYNSENVRRKAHFFIMGDSYEDIDLLVNELIDQGVSSNQISIVTDTESISAARRTGGSKNNNETYGVFVVYSKEASEKRIESKKNKQ